MVGGCSTRRMGIGMRASLVGIRGMGKGRSGKLTGNWYIRGIGSKGVGRARGLSIGIMGSKN